MRRFYWINIWLPVILPLAAALLRQLLLVFAGVDPGGTVASVLQFLASLGVFGLLYVPFALFASWWIRKCDEDSARFLMFVLPAIMLVVALILCAIMAFSSGRGRLWLEVGAFAATVILPVGYGFVLLTVTLRFLMRALVTDSSR